MSEEKRFPDVTMFGQVVSGDTRSVFGAVGCFWRAQLWLYEGLIVGIADGSCTFEWKLTCAGQTVGDVVRVPSLEVAVKELNKKAREFHNEQLWFLRFPMPATIPE